MLNRDQRLPRLTEVQEYAWAVPTTTADDMPDGERVRSFCNERHRQYIAGWTQRINAALREART